MESQQGGSIGIVEVKVRIQAGSIYPCVHINGDGLVRRPAEAEIIHVPRGVDRAVYDIADTHGVGLLRGIVGFCFIQCCLDPRRRIGVYSGGITLFEKLFDLVEPFGLFRGLRSGCHDHLFPKGRQRPENQKKCCAQYKQSSFHCFSPFKKILVAESIFLSAFLPLIQICYCNQESCYLFGKAIG